MDLVDDAYNDRKLKMSEEKKWESLCIGNVQRKPDYFNVCIPHCTWNDIYNNQNIIKNVIRYH